MDSQIKNYRRIAESLALGLVTTTKTNPISNGISDGISNGNGYKNRGINQEMAEAFIRDVVRTRLVKNGKQGIQIVKLEAPGWFNPPLQWCDLEGEYVGVAKVAAFTGDMVDKSSGGWAIPLWKWNNLEIATGHSFKRSPGEYFKFGWFVYCDICGNILMLSLTEIWNILRLDEPVRWGKIKSAEENSSDGDRALFVPSKLWKNIGELTNNQRNLVFNIAQIPEPERALQLDD